MEGARLWLEALLGIISLIALPRHGGGGGRGSVRQETRIGRNPADHSLPIIETKIGSENRSHPSHRWEAGPTLAGRNSSLSPPTQKEAGSLELASYRRDRQSIAHPPLIYRGHPPNRSGEGRLVK